MMTELQLINPKTVAGVSLMPEIAGLIREQSNVTTGAPSYSFYNEWDLDSFDVEKIRASYKIICADIKQNSDPLDDMQMAKLFTRAWVKTAGKSDDQISLDMVLDVYCEDLMVFPGELVRKVLTDWPDRNQWHPLWKPLVDEINRLDDRQRLKHAFRGMLNKLGVPFSELNELEV